MKRPRLLKLITRRQSTTKSATARWSGSGIQSTESSPTSSMCAAKASRSRSAAAKSSSPTRRRSPRRQFATRRRVVHFARETRDSRRRNLFRVTPDHSARRNTLQSLILLASLRKYVDWCPGKDSNLHGLHRWYLKPVRLPIPPPGPGALHSLRRPRLSMRGFGLAATVQFSPRGDFAPARNALGLDQLLSGSPQCLTKTFWSKPTAASASSG